jgi:alpha-N-acetylglucosaminidase
VSLYTAWELLRTSAYNNTNLKSNAVPKSIFELAPNITGLVNRTGHHPTSLNYNTGVIVKAWKALLSAAEEEEELWEHPAYRHDLVDVTRQVFANEFLATYTELVEAWNVSTPSNTTAQTVTTLSSELLENLQTLDSLLSTLPQFRLSTWLDSARARANNSLTNSTSNSTTDTTALADFYAYTALNQITLWGPNGEINDYASKQWGGLVGPYYGRRWSVFLEYLQGVGPAQYDAIEARSRVKAVESAFQTEGLVRRLEDDGDGRGVREVVEGDVLPFLKGIGL